MKKIENKIPLLYKNDIEKAIIILKQHGASEVFIFGSVANGNYNDESDIDIAVKGLESSNFYKVASILMFELENEIDLIDLDDKENRFSQMLLEKGGLLKVG